MPRAPLLSLLLRYRHLHKLQCSPRAGGSAWLATDVSELLSGLHAHVPGSIAGVKELRLYQFNTQASVRVSSSFCHTAAAMLPQLQVRGCTLPGDERLRSC